MSAGPALRPRPLKSVGGSVGHANAPTEMGGVFCSTQCPGVISIALALGASLIRPRFVCGGAAGVATGLQRHCLIATAGVVYRLRLPSAEMGHSIRSSVNRFTFLSLYPCPEFLIY